MGISLGCSSPLFDWNGDAKPFSNQLGAEFAKRKPRTMRQVYVEFGFEIYRHGETHPGLRLFVALLYVWHLVQGQNSVKVHLMSSEKVNFLASINICYNSDAHY